MYNRITLIVERRYNTRREEDDDFSRRYQAGILPSSSPDAGRVRRGSGNDNTTHADDPTHIQANHHTHIQANLHTHIQANLHTHIQADRYPASNSRRLTSARSASNCDRGPGGPYPSPPLIRRGAVADLQRE